MRCFRSNLLLGLVRVWWVFWSPLCEERSLWGCRVTVHEVLCRVSGHASDCVLVMANAFCHAMEQPGERAAPPSEGTGGGVTATRRSGLVMRETELADPGGRCL